MKIEHAAPAQPPATQAPPEHTWPAPQLIPQPPQLLVVPVGVSQPSAVLPLQSAKPVLQAMPQPDPVQRPVALAASRQVVVVLLVPSALHTLSVVAEAHEAVPGVQTVVTRHVPEAQVCPAGQAVAVYPRPSALHAWRALAEAQESSPGVQIHGVQAPARQVVRAPQAEAA